MTKIIFKALIIINLNIKNIFTLINLLTQSDMREQIHKPKTQRNPNRA
ncbi:MAG: hypothetical protein RIS64_214 [Bacteroidota bacterium]|jgi:hypothetical protein